MSEYTEAQLRAAQEIGAEVAEREQSADAGIAAFREALAAQTAGPTPIERPANPHVVDGDPTPVAFARLTETERLALEASQPGVSDRVQAAFVHEQREAERDPREREKSRREEQTARADDPLFNELAIKHDEHARRQAAETHKDRIEERIAADQMPQPRDQS